VLISIPLFTFAGYLLSESRAPHRLVVLTDAFLGWVPGGQAVVALVACSFFTAVTGASGVTIVALGALLYPALMESGYGEKFSLGLVTTSGCIGLLFAPSLPLILYAVVAQQLNVGEAVSINDMFLAAALPGVLLIVLLALWSFWSTRQAAARKTFSLRGAWLALRENFWEVPLPFFVLGGIYGGWFAVSEAAAVTALYVLVVEVAILREIPLRKLPAITTEAMVLVGGILIILGVSVSTTNYVIDAEIPARLFEWTQDHIANKYMFLLLLNIFLLILGAFLNIFSAVVMVVPLILPVAVGYGIHPVHLGVIFLANLQIGYLMPPAGLDLCISAFRFGKPIHEIVKASFPFALIILVTVLVITYWPWLSLWFLNG
jgi:tripartite ATP-independent transporter DctM subunit